MAEYPSARKDNPHIFKFDQPQDGVHPSIRLCLDNPPVEEPGWTVHPSREPMEVCHMLDVCTYQPLTYM